VSYSAMVYRVFLASPSDVIEERNVARGIINEWNYVHSFPRGLMLHPIGWETHSIPSMGDRPQAILNKQILKDSDLLIAIFRARLGTPTGDSRSGTVEEIEEHLKYNKPAMLYFSCAEINPDDIDHDQYIALEAFKKACEARGLIKQYLDINDFREKLSRNLAIMLNTSHFDKRLQPVESQDKLFPSAKRMYEIYSYLWHWLYKLKEIIIRPPIDKENYEKAYYEVNETLANNIPFLDIAVRDHTRKILSIAQFINIQIQHPQRDRYISSKFQEDKKEFINYLDAIEEVIRSK